jgi:hypothetical protein
MAGLPVQAPVALEVDQAQVGQAVVVGTQRQQVGAVVGAAGRDGRDVVDVDGEVEPADHAAVTVADARLLAEVPGPPAPPVTVVRAPVAVTAPRGHAEARVVKACQAA